MGDIKEYRKKELRDFVLVNVLMMLYFSEMIKPIFESLTTPDTAYGILNMAQVVFESAFVAGVVYVFVFIFDSLMTGNAKFKVAYFGKKELPGATVFTDLRKGRIKDLRFTIEDLILKYDEIFEVIDSDAYSDINCDMRRQYENSCWYKIYSKYASTEQKLWVAQKDILLCRDMTMACLYLLLVYLAGCMIFGDMKFSIAIVIMLGIEAVLCDIAMRSKGREFAVDVIATDIANLSNAKTEDMK